MKSQANSINPFSGRGCQVGLVRFTCTSAQNIPFDYESVLSENSETLPCLCHNSQCGWLNLLDGLPACEQRFHRPPDRALVAAPLQRRAGTVSPTRQDLYHATSESDRAHPRADLRSALDRRIEDTLERLRRETLPESRDGLLKQLREQLMSPDSKAEAVRAILEFLHSGRDASTGLAFRVGQGHTLAESPTLRTALLDWLGQLDPGSAGQYATRIFEAMASPEEYAIALRNFARGLPDQRDELRNHFNRLLTFAPWANQPTAGYLESFDVAPYLGDPKLIEPLSAFLAPSAQPPLRHASLVALDRLVLANPRHALAEMLKPATVNAQPLVRASFFARADVREASQRQLVERYLSSPGVSEAELDKFVRLFPNANRFVSHNLLTDSGGQSLADLASLDAAALEQVRAWRIEPRFSPLAPRLKQLESRLEEHVSSAIQGGYLAVKR